MESNLSKVKLMLIGLYSCPCNSSTTKPEDCQITKLKEAVNFPKNGTFGKWYEIIKSMPDEEAYRIYDEHKKCLVYMECSIAKCSNSEEKGNYCD